MSQDIQKEYTRLKAKEDKAKEASKLRRIRYSARDKFVYAFFAKNASDADKKALNEAMTSAVK